MIFSMFGEAKTTITLSVRNFITAEEALNSLIERRSENESDAFIKGIKTVSYAEALTVRESLAAMLHSNEAYKLAMDEGDFDYLAAILDSSDSEEVVMPEDKYSSIPIPFTSTINNISVLLTVMEYYVEDKARKESDMEELIASREWAPPENYQYGTDNEREVWDIYQKQNRANSQKS